MCFGRIVAPITTTIWRPVGNKHGVSFMKSHEGLRWLVLPAAALDSLP